jgi:hypothetical protein
VNTHSQTTELFRWLLFGLILLGFAACAREHYKQLAYKQEKRQVEWFQVLAARWESDSTDVAKQLTDAYLDNLKASASDSGAVQESIREVQDQNDVLIEENEELQAALLKLVELCSKKKVTVPAEIKDLLQVQ